jgi:NADPH:quinone reductase-like Zn-dependent oxidoreductase
MRAVKHQEYGPPEVLRVAETDQPVVTDDGVLVRVRAASLNPLDWHGMTGTPYLARIGGLRRPKDERLGADFAGTVEAVGKDVNRFRPGDEVFGAATGAFAEYVVARQDRIGPKPTNLTFEQAAAVPVAGLTALQGLRDKGRIQAGQDVLINGAAGGVGTFAVQVAKARGGTVTGVCSTRNVELVRSLGADHVIDYTQEDFTRGGQRYDLMLDNIGNRSWSECKRVLRPDATLVLVSGPKTNRLLGPLSHVIKTRLASVGSRPKVTFFVASMKTADLETLRELLEAGRIVPVVERTYPLSDIAEAMRYLGTAHAQGKLVLTV